METDVIHNGDALQVLKTLPDESIDCCITSPPYWGLRDYGVEGQFGLEPDFRDYIKNLADIFDEVKRVLKSEGTCWVNLGDTYANAGTIHNGHHGGITAARERYDGRPRHQANDTRANGSLRSVTRTKQIVPSKSLVQIPSRFAIEMSDRGWILRNEIIWRKRSCMPSSATDRFTVDFEKMFFFVKSKSYYFQQQFEPLADPTRTNFAPGKSKLAANSSRNDGDLSERAKTFSFPNGKNKRTVWDINPKPFKEAHFAVFPEALVETPIKAGCPPFGIVLDPFMGAGTTALVAQKLVRHYIGIELNPEYIEIAQRRLHQPTLELAS